MSQNDPNPEDEIDRLLLQCLDEPHQAWCDCIESHCASHPELAAELRRRFETLVARGMLPSPDSAEGHSAPRRLGHYRLVQQLGGGGMGVVYEAHDERLDRRVALKLIRADQRFFAGTLERFEREMHAGCRIDHPNLCSIYEAGELDGVPYIAMRYVEGQSLADLIARRRRDGGSSLGSSRASSPRAQRQALLVLEKLARALHAAHVGGVVHRDVKPANVLIGRDGEPVLVDFGLARDDAASHAALTQSGERIGTPAYMAPEQVSGKGTVDRRTDVYALGATLYECLTLNCPFASPTREELYSQILHDPVRDPRSLDRSIGRELSVVVRKALEKNPRDRFESAEQLADELRRIRTHQPIRSRRPGILLRATRWAQRNRAASGILVATALGLALSLWALHQNRLSMNRFRALAWLRAAEAVEDRDPELAFKCAREAFRLYEDPVIVAAAQETRFGMRRSTPILQQGSGLLTVAHSSDGRFLIFRTRAPQPVLLGREGNDWKPSALPVGGFSDSERFETSAFSPDGSELSIGTTNAAIHRFDLRSNTPTLRDVLRHDRQSIGGNAVAWDLNYSPDGDELLASYGSRTIQWSATGKMTRVLVGREWLASAYLPNGCIAASGWLWTRDGEQIAELPAPKQVRWVLVGRNRFYAITARWFQFGDFQPIHVFGFDGQSLDAEQQPRWMDPRDDIRYAELDPSGERLLVHRTDGRIQLLDADSLTLLHQWRVGGSRWNSQVRFSPDGTRIAGGHEQIQFRSAQNGRILGDIRGLQGNLRCLDWSPNGRSLAAVSAGGAARVWELALPETIQGFVGHGSADVDVSPSGSKVAFTSSVGAVYLCDASGTVLREQSMDAGLSYVRFVAENELVISYEGKPDFFVWRPDAEEKPASLELLETPLALGRHPPIRLEADRWLLWGDKRVALWHRGQRELQRWRNDSPFNLPNEAVAVSTDRRHVVTGNVGIQLTTLTTLAGSAVWSPVETVYAEYLTFSKDGRYVLVASDDTRAYLWNIEDQTRKGAVFSGHQNGLNCAAFSTDETRIATSSWDGSIRIWDRDSQKTQLRLRHPGVTRVVFTADNQLVSAGNDGTVRWWWLEAGPLRQAIGETVVEELTPTELQRVAHYLDQ